MDMTKNLASEGMKSCWEYYGDQATISYEKNINADGTSATDAEGTDALKLYGANHTADYNATDKYRSALYLNADAMAQLLAGGYKTMNITFSYKKDNATTSNTPSYRILVCDYDMSGEKMDHNKSPKHFTTSKMIQSGTTEETWNTVSVDISFLAEGETLAIVWWMQTMYISSITFSV